MLKPVWVWSTLFRIVRNRDVSIEAWLLFELLAGYFPFQRLKQLQVLAASQDVFTGGPEKRAPDPRWPPTSATTSIITSQHGMRRS
jgi:hypothetical protein